MIVGKSLSEFEAIAIISGECRRAYAFGCTFTEDLANREIRFQITKGGVALLDGSICPAHPSGFPVRVCLASGGRLTLTSEDGLRKFLRDGFHEHFNPPALGVALEDSKATPVYASDGVTRLGTSYEVQVATTVPESYFVPQMSPEALAEAKAAIRAQSEQMILPRMVPVLEEIDLDRLPLDQLRTFRDRLNEVIYDKEQGK